MSRSVSQSVRVILPIPNNDAVAFSVTLSVKVIDEPDTPDTADTAEPNNAAAAAVGSTNGIFSIVSSAVVSE